jgi:hypothetical protein
MITCNACGRKLIANNVRGHLQYRCRMKDEYPGRNHPKSLSVREDQLMPVIDGWLAQLFDNDHIDQTIRTLTGVNLDESGPTEELAARRAIRQIDKRIANFEAALGLTEDPESLAGFTRRIELASAERRTVELRLRQTTRSTGLSETEIRQAAGNLAEAIRLLSTASAEDRRRVYEAAQLEVLYDHENRRAQLSVAPGVSSGVGGATHTLSTRNPWTGSYLAAA